MIGVQCAQAGEPVDQQQASASAASSPKSRRSSASSSSSSSSTSSCSAASSPRDLVSRIAGQLNQQLPSIQQHGSAHSLSNSKTTHNGTLNESEERELGAGSPGYHSAAPSPGGSTSSSVASPISSSASTSSTSVCSSSGVSTASILSVVSTHSSVGLLQQQRQSTITTTASSTRRLSHQQQQHQQQQNNPLTSSNIVNSLTSQQMSQQLTAPHVQQQTNYAPLMRAQHQQEPHQRNNIQQANGLDALLDHFPEACREPLNLSWFHEANNRAALNAALNSTKLIVVGDISLAEMSRYPVPIMARPPLGVSDLTLENWITDVLQARRGIKLTFTSTRTVEPAFRVLARHADKLRGPLVLSADILARPQAAGSQAANKQQQQPVDAWTFLMLCRTRFPKSIISIGWCGSPCESAPVESGIGQAESMFELDMLEQHNQQQQHQFSSPILHLSHQGRPQNHQPLSAFQPHAPLLNRQLLQSGRAVQFGNSSCTSSGSLNSSSGNSSGSPSPTSPVGSSSVFGNCVSGAHNQGLQRVRHQQRAMHPNHSVGGSPGGAAQHLIMAAAAAAAAQEHKLAGSPASGHLRGSWSAVAAAAMVAQLQQQQQQQDQLPLNLNINEAEPQHAVAQLQELAHTIQQLQQQSSSLEHLSSSLHQQQQSGEATAAALALASNILQSNTGNLHTGHAHQLLINELREAQKWEHVSKKAAISNQLNSNSPSPISTSPKQQPASAINLLSCVPMRPANKPLNRAPSGFHQQQQQQRIRIPQQHQKQPEVAGYTREMIDKMSSLVKDYNLTQAVTFPVEARWLVRRHSAHFAHSLSELQRLLSQVGPNSTLTLIAQSEDLISADELQLIRKYFAPSQILFDLPHELAQALKHHELSTSGGNR